MPKIDFLMRLRELRQPVNELINAAIYKGLVAHERAERIEV